MKRILLMAVAAAFVCGCEKQLPIDEQEVEVKTKKFTFTCKGDFNNPTFSGIGSTRAVVNLSDESLTDVWVFDFIGGECVQSLHQESSTAGDTFGRPQLPLAYGSHHVYFVASRGTGPVVNTTAKTITWQTPRDTYWKDYEVNVTSTSNGNRSVTLDRVVTKLRISINDGIPTGMSTMSVTPSVWYYGMNYQTGEPSNMIGNQERVVSVPTTYIGTTGQLSMSIFGFSSDTEWTSDITVVAKNGDGVTIGSASMTGAPLKRNRSTDYSGNLFSSGGAATMTVNNAWDTPVTLSW